MLATACILALAASSARAAEQWNDGVPAMSTQVKCVINLQETGAIAEAGYLADPSKLPQAAQVFYGHADFGATTDTACSSGDQVAELDVVLAPGVSLAVDAAHPITCLYGDNGGPGVNDPTCPTHAITGALAAVAKKGLGLSMRCATACKGHVKVEVAAATAKRLHLAKGALTLTSGRFSAAAGKTATVHLKLSRQLAGKVRKLKSLAVTVTVTPSGAAKTVAHLTLHR